MDWLELTAQVDREAVEAVSEIFARHGYGGTVIEEPIVSDPGGDGYSVDWSLPVTVKTYLPNDDEAQSKQDLISSALWHLGRIRPVEPLAVRNIAEVDWANAWKSHYQVQRVGRRIVIKPSWQEHPFSADDIVVELDPGMAFGTGTHPTTRLCMEELERLVYQGARVLDLGTGSGILAIAASRLGAASVLALDVDDIAVAAARENVARNRLSDRITVLRGSLGADGPWETSQVDRFDIVVANITARAIAGLAKPLVSALEDRGKLLLSGIIADQADLVLEALGEAGAEIVLQREASDWLVLVARKS